MTDDERAVRDLLPRWFDASRKGDIATVLTLMTEDAVFMVPGMEPFGKDAFRRASDRLKGVQIDGTNDIRELRVLGDWAYLRMYLTVTMRPPDGPSVTRAGYTLTILRKEGGQWRLSRDANLLSVQT